MRLVAASAYPPQKTELGRQAKYGLLVSTQAMGCSVSEGRVEPKLRRSSFAVSWCFLPDDHGRLGNPRAFRRANRWARL
jgi:hypothetical protein